MLLGHALIVTAYEMIAYGPRHYPGDGMTLIDGWHSSSLVLSRIFPLSRKVTRYRFWQRMQQGCSPADRRHQPVSTQHTHKQKACSFIAIRRTSAW